MRKLRILPIATEHFPWVMELAGEEGWNLGLHDLTNFHSQDPEGFLMGFLEQEPAGCIQACRYGENFGFIGLHLVAKNLRGQGYGSQLWESAMEHLATRTIGMEGLFTKQEFYRKYGFLFHYTTIHYEYPNNTPPDVTDARIADASVLPFNQLLEYDTHHFGFERSLFLRNWIHTTGVIALGLRSGNNMKGFGCIRPCQQGYKVGPLYAEHPEDAEKIFFSLCSRTLKGASVFLDIPEKNPAASSLCETYCMLPISATARMYANGAPALPLTKIYGITTLEQG